jgi:hypothetical protein
VVHLSPCGAAPCAAIKGAPRTRTVSLGRDGLQHTQDALRLRHRQPSQSSRQSHLIDGSNLIEHNLSLFPLKNARHPTRIERALRCDGSDDRRRDVLIHLIRRNHHASPRSAGKKHLKPPRYHSIPTHPTSSAAPRVPPSAQTPPPTPREEDSPTGSPVAHPSPQSRTIPQPRLLQERLRNPNPPRISNLNQARSHDYIVITEMPRRKHLRRSGVLVIWERTRLEGLPLKREMYS